jgi:hypothetical protein
MIATGDVVSLWNSYNSHHVRCNVQFIKLYVNCMNCSIDGIHYLVSLIIYVQSGDIQLNYR